MILFFVFLLIEYHILKVFSFFVHFVLVHSFFLKYCIYLYNILNLLRITFVLLYGKYGIVRLYILPFLYFLLVIFYFKIQLYSSSFWWSTTIVWNWSNIFN